ncbi:MAG: hypothetical protein AABW63_03860 [Nanoarchaeota archaeon]
MDLKQLYRHVSSREESLRKVIDDEERKIEEEAKKKAREIRLKDILAEIKFDPKSLGYEGYEKFVKTKMFNLDINREYKVYLENNKLVLKLGEIELRSFGGVQVGVFYRKLLRSVEALEEQGEYDLPF